MAVYIGFLIISFVFGIRHLILGNSSQQKKVFYIFFIYMFIVLALRKMGVGVDTLNYPRYFIQSMSVSSASNLLNVFTEEYLFYGFFWIVSRITNNFQWVMVICAIPICFSLAKFFSKEVKDHQNPILPLVLFLSLCPFAFFFSGLSQCMAMCFVTPIFWFAKKNKIIPCVLLSIIAFLFHNSGILLLLIYPVYHLKLKFKHLFFIIPFIGGTFVFRSQIFMSLIVLFGKYNRDYGSTTETASYEMLVLYILLVFYAFIIPNKSLDKEFIGIRNFSILIVIIQCMAPIHHLVMRVNYYFLPFLVLLLTNVKDYCEGANKRIAQLANIVFVLFFSFYFIYSIYTESAGLQIYPYIPFWK